MTILLWQKCFVLSLRSTLSRDNLKIIRRVCRFNCIDECWLLPITFATSLKVNSRNTSELLIYRFMFTRLFMESGNQSFEVQRHERITRTCTDAYSTILTVKGNLQPSILWSRKLYDRARHENECESEKKYYDVRGSVRRVINIRKSCGDSSITL